MKTRQLHFLTAITMFSLFACGEKKSEEASYDKADNTAVSADSVSEMQLPTNTFIRTADLKFRVKNTQKSSDEIEDIITKYDGYITNSNLSTNIENRNLVEISADSSLETIKYNVSNHLTIKIPNQKLNQTLREISKEIDFLDNKTLAADDAYLQILSNQMKVKRNMTFQNRLAKKSDHNYKNLSKVADTEENILSKQESSDEASLANIDLNMKIEYSTIEIEIYQRETITKSILLSDKITPSYEPPFYLKLWESLKFGFEIIETIILTLIKFWGIAALLLISYLTYLKLKPSKIIV